MNTAAMLSTYGLDKDMPLMEGWLDYTHGDKHMSWGEYLKFWARGKEEFLTKLFSGQLIHKFDVNFSKSADEMRATMINDRCYNMAMEDIDRGINRILKEFFTNRYKLHDVTNYAKNCLISFFTRGRMTDVVRVLKNNDILISDEEYNFLTQMSDVFYAIDRVSTGYESMIENKARFVGHFRIPGACKPFRVTENQKPIKVLTSFVKYFADYVSEDAIQLALESIETFRIVHSQILNTKNIHGRLCLSIHPMDFMTMSDNDCDWHSCMRWEDNEGEYHAGTLEMMTSKSVIIAYLESKDSWYPVPGMDKTWSNKKWRELFIVTPDFITGIKGYPYNSKSLETIVFEKLAEMMKQNMGIEFNTQNVDCRKGGFVAPNGKAINFLTNIMYNDCNWNEVSTIFANGYAPDRNSKFWYGEGAYCIKCGKMRLNDNDQEGFEHSLLCFECSAYCRCAHCGELIYDESDCYEGVNGEVVCRNCYRLITTCEVTNIREYESCDGGEENFADLTISCKMTGDDSTLEYHIWVHNTVIEALDSVNAVTRKENSWGDPFYVLIAPVPKETSVSELKAFREYLERYFYRYGEKIVYNH